MSDGLDGLGLLVGQGFGDPGQGGEGAQLLSFPVGVFGRIKCEALLGKLDRTEAGTSFGGRCGSILASCTGGEAWPLNSEGLLEPTDSQSGLATLRYQMLPLVRVQEYTVSGSPSITLVVKVNAVSIVRSFR